jgi:hypothetical protein
MSSLKRKRGAEPNEPVTTAKVSVIDASYSKLGPVLGETDSFIKFYFTDRY